MADYSKYYEAREVVTRILEQDFIGPVTKDECLAEVPVQYYIMGKLYPQKDTVEALDLARNPLLENEIETYDVSISLSNQNNPSSMGITVTLKVDVSAICVSGSYAFYEPTSFDDAKECGIDTSRWEHLEKKPKEIWQRNEYSYDEKVIFTGERVEYADLPNGLQLQVYTHSMMRTCGIEWSPDLSQHFYEKELPATFMAAEDVPAYDLVIIDEGQDLLTDTYLECVDRIVRDGLGNGTWAIYYDPNQNIFNSYAQLDAMIMKLRKEAYAMSWKLHANCRNTKQIANANILMTNIPNQGKPTVSGPQVEYDSYNGREDERRKINAIVRNIKDSGAVGGDFVILSRYTLTNSHNGLGLTGLDKDLGTLKTTGPLWKAKKNDVRFSTISGFKGLESKIVIMIDIDHFSNEETRLLNYVAASRACAMLYVLYDCNAEQERQNMILSGFTQVGA